MEQISRHCPHCGEMIADPDGQFEVVVICRDCTGVDDMGCGEGRPWRLDETFTTHEAACHAGYDATSGPPWDHEVVRS